MKNTNNQKYLDLVRKCATIISKNSKYLEIMDSSTFETLKADIDKTLFDKANINDQVTYVKTKNKATVLEVRKQ